jgi:hypothetical protein
VKLADFFPDYAWNYCGESNHKTKNSHWQFAHMHVDFTIPEGFLMIEQKKNGNWVPVGVLTDAAIKINAYWDDEFYPYHYPAAPPAKLWQKTGNATFAYNCWSYALDKTDCWVFNPEYIYLDDYEQVPPCPPLPPFPTSCPSNPLVSRCYDVSKGGDWHALKVTAELRPGGSPFSLYHVTNRYDKQGWGGTYTCSTYVGPIGASCLYKKK